MKSILPTSNILGLTLIIAICLSCGKPKETVIHKDQITGYVQKGPFINGTTILLYELNSSLNQTGKAFNTQINNNAGSFSINDVTLSSQFVEFLASGYYFNEVSGDISSSVLSLYALSDVSDISSVNVNLLTHLEKSRVEYLISQGKGFTDAKDSAQKEVLNIFGFKDQGLENSEMLDISVDKDENAILLAISIILQGQRTTGELTELLANISDDIKQDGKLDDKSILTELTISAEALDLQQIRTNLALRYEDLGISATIPDFEKYINDFLTSVGSKPTVETRPADNIFASLAIVHGLVNAHNLTTIVSFDFGTTTNYDNTMPAVESPVSGNTDVTVQDTIYVSQPNTIYHFRVKAVNAIGTSFGNDLTFRSAGKK